MIAAEKKQQIINEHSTHEGDTGSPQIQIAVLTARILEVAEHLRGHKGDQHGRRGLVQMVAKRNSLLRYLQRTDRDAYLATIKKLGLRK